MCGQVNLLAPLPAMIPYVTTPGPATNSSLSALLLTFDMMGSDWQGRRNVGRPQQSPSIELAWIAAEVDTLAANS